MSERIHICTFCGKHHGEVGCMIKPQPGLTICDACVEEMMLAVLCHRHPEIGAKEA